MSNHALVLYHERVVTTTITKNETSERLPLLSQIENPKNTTHRRPHQYGAREATDSIDLARLAANCLNTADPTPNFFHMFLRDTYRSKSEANKLLHTTAPATPTAAHQEQQVRSESANPQTRKPADPHARRQPSADREIKGDRQ